MKFPKAIRKAVWVKYIGEKWKSKCTIDWCENEIDVLGSWHIGHNIPRARGGSNRLSNLRPICADCNQGMGSRMTIVQWNSEFTDNIPEFRFSDKYKRRRIA